jgi:hypothetical protein
MAGCARLAGLARVAWERLGWADADGEKRRRCENKRGEAQSNSGHLSQRLFRTIALTPLAAAFMGTPPPSRLQPQRTLCPRAPRSIHPIISDPQDPSAAGPTLTQAGSSSGLLDPKRAPPRRRDLAGDRLASIRSDEQVAAVAPLAVLRRRLIFHRALSKLSRLGPSGSESQQRRGPCCGDKDSAASKARRLALIAHFASPRMSTHPGRTQSQISAPLIDLDQKRRPASAESSGRGRFNGFSFCARLDHSYPAQARAAALRWISGSGLAQRVGVRLNTLVRFDPTSEALQS